MPENKTIPNQEASVKAFLRAVEDPAQRKDGFTLLEMFIRITGEPAVLWGPSIVGFGTYHYTYPSGREGDMLRTGFSPRKRELSLYIMAGLNRYEKLLTQLGKHKTGKSCLYIKNLSDVNHNVLEELIAESYAYTKMKYDN